MTKNDPGRDAAGPEAGHRDAPKPSNQLRDRHTIHAVAARLRIIAETPELTAYARDFVAGFLIAEAQILEQIAAGGCIYDLDGLGVCTLEDDHDGPHVAHDGTAVHAQETLSGWLETLELHR